MTKIIKNLSEITADYDAYIIDLWGVLHDGAAPYPGAIDCLEKLKAAGKEIVLLSNAPRRAYKAAEVLNKLGFKEEHYDHLLTSGEITFKALEADENIGNRFFYIGPSKDEDILEGSRFIQVMEPYDADFIVTTGFDDLGDPDFGDHMAMKKPVIDTCLKMRKPMICANPDMHVVKQCGKKMLCAGVIAEYYEQNGGDVTYFGKPYEPAYQAIFDLLGHDDVKRYCAIGDNLQTDIKGAANLGIYSLLVAGGVLASQMDNDGDLDADVIEKICIDEGVKPDSVIKSFIW